jgi:hypothetical protein
MAASQFAQLSTWLCSTLIVLRAATGEDDDVSKPIRVETLAKALSICRSHGEPRAGSPAQNESHDDYRALEGKVVSALAR